MFASIISFLRSVMAHSMTSAVSQSKVSETVQTSSPHSHFLPLPSSRHLEIEEYVRLIRTTASSSTEYQDQLNQHKVLKLEHIKEKGKAQHERVIAVVSDHNEKVVRLSIERSKGQQITVPNGNEQKNISPESFTSTTTMALSSLPNSSEHSILKPAPAMDVVQNIGDFSFPESRLRTVFKPNPPIPLLRLVIIIESIHDRNTSYTILRNQCYWFAMLVMGVAMSLGGHVQLFPDKGKAGICDERSLKPLRLSEPDIDTLGLGEIPIQPGPHAKGEPYMTVKDLGTAVGSHNGIPIVAVSHKEIFAVAVEVQGRYEDALKELDNKKSARRAAEEALKQQIREQAQREAAAAYAEELAALRRQVAAAMQAE